MRNYRFIVIAIIVGLVGALPQQTFDLKTKKIRDEITDRNMHGSFVGDRLEREIFGDDDDENENTGRWYPHETDNSFWYDNAHEQLNAKLGVSLNTRVAKNIIFFLGDGMSIPTLMAARTYLGQLEGKPGEDGSLFWETFPYTGLSKNEEMKETALFAANEGVHDPEDICIDIEFHLWQDPVNALLSTWCVDKQVPDSACTSTAYMGGVKTKYGTLGLNGNVKRGKCETQIEANHVDSIAKWAQDHGKGTGIVTTTRVTHASPGGAFAHSADRNWESDTDVLSSGYDPKKCQDIASQLVNNEPGKNFKVILGGGRRSFLPRTTIDEKGDKGKRTDGVNLIDEWKRDKHDRNSRYAYVSNRTSLKELIEHPDDYDHVLGLFDASHCPYHLEASPEVDPTLADMTEAAVKLLQKEENGYFLFVEGGRIDHAHHNTYATIALDETVELAKAVKIAREITSESDTLIIVTADHAHTMSVSGYPKRGNSINDITGIKADDDIPYATLTYATGPGYRPEEEGSRYNPAKADYDNPRYQSPTLAPLGSATHGGDDVAIFASGPWAHLFTGTMEQSNIPHYLGYASCIGRSDMSACATPRAKKIRPRRR